MTGYTLDSTEGRWPQQVKFTLPGHIFKHFGFPSVRVVLSVTFIPGFVMYIDYIKDSRLTDEGRLLPSLYTSLYSKNVPISD